MVKRVNLKLLIYMENKLPAGRDYFLSMHYIPQQDDYDSILEGILRTFY